ncbi:hypothetical protein Tcan_01299, partial [Toxocara canis]
FGFLDISIIRSMRAPNRSLSPAILPDLKIPNAVNNNRPDHSWFVRARNMHPIV